MLPLCAAPRPASQVHRTGLPGAVPAQGLALCTVMRLERQHQRLFREKRWEHCRPRTPCTTPSGPAGGGARLPPPRLLIPHPCTHPPLPIPPWIHVLSKFCPISLQPSPASSLKALPLSISPFRTSRSLSSSYQPLLPPPPVWSPATRPVLLSLGPAEPLLRALLLLLQALLGDLTQAVAFLKFFF